VVLRNGTEEDIEYPDCRPLCYPLVIKDRWGREVRYTGGGQSILQGSERVRAGESLVLLESYDITREYDLKSRGKYKVQFGAELEIAEPRSETAEPRSEGGDDPASWGAYVTKRFPSNTVEIEVIPKSGE
jgi:hypothetical protein